MAARATWPASPAKPVPPRAFTRSFPAQPAQVREARAFLRAALDGCPAADDAVLCVSELAANAVLHSDSGKAGGAFTVRAEVHPGDYIWVEVEDNGGAWGHRAHSDGRPHGLDIVRAIATDSGIDGDPVTGWVAWARLDVPPADPPHPAGGGSHASGGAAPAREPAPGATTMTSAGRALTGLRDALAALGIATTGLILTRHNGTLHPEHGPAVGYHGGLYWWPVRRLHASRPVYAIHDATDPAGAARRIASHHSPPPWPTEIGWRRG
jgi:serine/threonine-protein kinase RsbW